jgi:hypothetical protein
MNKILLFAGLFAFVLNCFSLGFLRTVSETKWLNLFVYLGSRFQYTVDDYYHTYYPTYNEEETFQAGGGPGVEIKFGRVSLNWMTGIRGKTNFNDLQEINFSTDVGAYYTF